MAAWLYHFAGLRNWKKQARQNGILDKNRRPLMAAMRLAEQAGADADVMRSGASLEVTMSSTGVPPRALPALERQRP